jgi:hypothetical protein
MMGPCCTARPAPHRLLRRLFRVTASILPAAALALLPKCPLCLAAWLTVATGITFPAAAAAWLRLSIVLVWVVALAAVVWRHGFGRAAAPAGIQRRRGLDLDYPSDLG